MLKSLAILGVCVTFLLGRPCVAEDNKATTNTASAQPQRDGRVVPPSSATVDPSNAAPLGKNESANQKADSPEKPLPRFFRPEWVIVYITAIYSLIAGITLWVIKRQADIMEGGAIDAIKSASDAATTAQGTLDAIKEQARIMRDQANLLVDHKLVFIESMKAARQSAEAAKTSADIAAGVSIPTLVIHEFETGDVGAADVSAFFQCPKVKITVKNYGNTPAFLKWWSLCFSCESLPEVPVYEGPGAGIFLSKVVVQSGDTYTLPELFYLQRQMFSLEDVGAIVRREKVFCAYGYICYGDIFGNTLRRLKFCETVLNIIPGYEAICDWYEGLGPRQYEGIDILPADEPVQQKTENPN